MLDKLALIIIRKYKRMIFKLAQAHVRQELHLIIQDHLDKLGTMELHTDEADNISDRLTELRKQLSDLCNK